MKLSGDAVVRFLDDAGASEVWLGEATARAQSHGPLAGCAWIARQVLAADNRAERVSCLLSDIVLAKTLGWKTPLPLTALHLRKATLRALVAEHSTMQGIGQGSNQADGVLAFQKAILRSIQDVIGMANSLTQSAAALRAVAPKLRAKTSEAAIKVFLTEDAVTPSLMLSPVIQGSATRMTPRAARRFCDRLVELGVVRELTGRATFRMYGL